MTVDSDIRKDNNNNNAIGLVDLSHGGVTRIQGIPHAVTRDNMYEGYVIPKGATTF